MKHLRIFILLFTASIAFASPSATIKITKDEYGEKWPFTVSEGVIGYEALSVNGKTLAIITFTAEGKTYPLNGIARSRSKERGYHDIDSIWRDNPKIQGAKIDIFPIIDRGFTLEKK